MMKQNLANDYARFCRKKRKKNKKESSKKK